MQASVINDLRTDHILSMAGKGTQDFNCWGATQYVLRVRDTLAWIEIDEMSDWLIENTEVVKTPEVGDILTLFFAIPFDKDKRMLLHTAVYLGDGEYLHKLGQSKAERATKRQVIAHYKMTNFYEIRRMKCD